MADRARNFARLAHQGQKYGGGEFHEKHLERVVATLHSFGESAEKLIAAAWLHDTVEDTPTTILDIRREFGDDVADLVWRLTDEAGETRRERHTKTHAKIRQSPDAARVKLADRIANVEASIEERNPLLETYRDEHEQFRRELYRPGEWEDMWARLDNLLE